MPELLTWVGHTVVDKVINLKKLLKIIWLWTEIDDLKILKAILNNIYCGTTWFHLINQTNFLFVFFTQIDTLKSV